MSVIALPRNRVWTQQPPASLVPNHAIGRVRFLVGGSDRLRDAISGKVADYGANPYGYGVNKNGRQGKFDYSGAGTYAGVTLPGDKPLIVTWTEQTSATSGYMGVANLGFGGANPCAIFRAFSDSAYSFSVGVLGTDSAVFATIGAPVTGVPATYSAVFPKGLNSGTKSEVVVFKNGQRHVPTGTSSFGASPLNDRIVIGGIQGYSYYGLLGNFSVIEGSSEVLARELSLNPFLAFAPRSAPLFVPVSAGGGGATITTNLGTASAIGYQATISASSPVTITGNVGQATASGLSATLAQAFTLSANKGTATASGNTATIAQAATVSANLGTSTAQGLTASVSSAGNVTVSCNLGTATAYGNQANIGANVTVSASRGAASAAGYTAALEIAYTLAASLGTASATGKTATIYANESIACAVGIALASGYSATITNNAPLTDSEKIDLILDILSNRQTLDPVSHTYTLYADDGVTVLKTALAFEDAAGLIPYRGQALQRLDGMT